MNYNWKDNNAKQKELHLNDARYLIDFNLLDTYGFISLRIDPKDGKGNIIISYQTYQKKFDISRARSSEEKAKIDVLDYLNSIKETKDIFTLAVYYAQLTDLPFNADVFEDFLEYVKPYMKE